MYSIHMHSRSLAIAMTGLAVLMLVISACGRSGDGTTALAGVSDGERVFTCYCAPCHVISAEQKLGPGMAGLFAPGGPILPAGVDYGGKLPNGAAISEANVAAWIRRGGAGQIGQMPGIPLGDEEMAALLVYLKSLEPAAATP